MVVPAPRNCLGQIERWTKDGLFPTTTGFSGLRFHREYFMFSAQVPRLQDRRGCRRCLNSRRNRRRAVHVQRGHVETPAAVSPRCWPLRCTAVNLFEKTTDRIRSNPAFQYHGPDRPISRLEPLVLNVFATMRVDRTGPGPPLYRRPWIAPRTMTTACSLPCGGSAAPRISRATVRRRRTTRHRHVPVFRPAERRRRSRWGWSNQRPRCARTAT